MSDIPFPSQAQIERAIRAAFAAGLKPVGFKVERGAVSVFTVDTKFGSRVEPDESNDFDT